MATILAGGINLSKIDKRKIVTRNKQGEKFENDAKFLNLSIFIKDEPDQYGNNAAISIQQTEEERKNGDDRIYLGNAKIVWQSDEDAPTQVEGDIDDDDLPF